MASEESQIPPTNLISEVRMKSEHWYVLSTLLSGFSGWSGHFLDRQSDL